MTKKIEREFGIGNSPFRRDPRGIKQAKRGKRIYYGVIRTLGLRKGRGDISLLERDIGIVRPPCDFILRGLLEISYYLLKARVGRMLSRKGLGDRSRHCN